MNFAKEHIYIFTTVIATMFAIAVWWLMPKEYAAQTKFSDENKEINLAVGLNKVNAQLQELAEATNSGINDIEVYCRILKSYDIASKVANTPIPNSELRYGEYLGEKDTLNTIRDKISYNISSSQQTLTVQFIDSNPFIASIMLDSIVSYLQSTITTRRHEMVAAKLESAKEYRLTTREAYKKSLQEYADYADTNTDVNSPVYKVQLDKLKKDVEDKFEIYKAAAETCVRYELLQKRTYSSFATIKCNSVPQKSCSYLIGYVMFSVLFSLLAVKGWHLYKRHKQQKQKIDLGGILSPWCITILVWGILMFIMQFRDPSLLNAPTSQFYISIVLWIVFFTTSSLITYNLLHSTPQNVREMEHLSTMPIKLDGIGMFFFNTLLMLSIVLTPLYVKKVLDIVMMFGTEDLLSNMRTLAVHGNENSVLNYSIVINETLLIVCMCAYPNVKLWKVIVVCCGHLLNSLAIMEKGGLLLLAFCIVYILYQRKVLKIRTIAFIGICVIFLSYLFTITRMTKAEQESDTDFSIFKFIAMYLLSPPVAYSQLNMELTPQFGAHTFPLFYYFMNKFGMGTYVFFDRLQDFVFVPVSTNVYTILQPFYMDFGQLGIAVFAVIYGVMTGWTYRNMRNGNAFAKCFYMYIAFVLVLQFFQEYIFTGNLHIVQLILFLYLCTQHTFVFASVRPNKKHKICHKQKTVLFF